LVRLPVPRVVAAILLQIVHQTATLFYETRRVAAAMAVRGATGSLGTAWRVLVSLPQVWLPRVIGRAERVAAAMELRGFCDGEPHTFSEVETGVVDLVAVGLCLLAIVGAVAVRVWGAT
jgi:energy-coupling factor transporter transmembrane protein EcfT